ncbi:MAG: FliH/SctL family protein [Deltaproteobacteria bacterium]|nr:FliH/SctL family protein [Deltaproteobacteria bacterium]
MSTGSWPPAAQGRPAGSKAVDWIVKRPVPSEHPAFATATGKPSDARSGASKDPARAAPEQPEAEAKGRARPEPELAVRIEEMDRSLDLLARAITQVAEAGKLERRRAQEQTVELGFVVAGELAAGAIEAQPERVAELVRGAFELLIGEGPLRVRLHPDLYRRMEGKGLLAGLAGDAEVAVRPDPALDEAGCVVESDVRKVDAGVRTRLQRLRHLFEQSGGGA